MIFDSHAHYDDEAFDEDRERLLQQLPEEGITRVVNVGASFDTCEKTIALMERYDYVYGALGIHPSDTDTLTEENFTRLAHMCEHEKCVAVGEIGLDYHWDEPDREIQKKWFRRQLNLARELKLPVVIHSRDAAQDTIQIMREEHAEAIGGVIHCFAYTKETAQIFLDMGFFIGVGGVVTFKNAKKLKEAVEMIPLERIVLETDCPYLAPDPHRGQRNCSLYIPHMIEKIAEIKGLQPTQVEAAAYENTLRLYQM